MKVLVFNCGSSSIKYQLFDMPKGTITAKGTVQRIGEKESSADQKAGSQEIRLKEPIADHGQGLKVIERMLTDPARGVVPSMKDIDACGHRVVHGGEDFSGSMRIDDKVVAAVERYADLAPLHNPPNLTGIRAAMAMMGDTPQVACFDTAFHQTIPPVAHLYALPYAMYEKYRIRKYGFHGTSHRWVARRAAAFLGKGKYDVDLITCHLGNGCSMAAVKAGRSVDTSMGLTPLEGLVMGTRTGDIDPAIIFYLTRKGHTPDDLDAIFNKKSGLLGVSGISNDVRTLEEKAAAGDKRAQLALDIFAYRIRKYIGAYLAVLNGCSAIVLTGGIGENGVAMRTRILEHTEKLGIVLDESRNRKALAVEAAISADTSPIPVLVIPTNEEAAIARDTYDLISGKVA
jgi:acetate kinase